MALSSLLPRRLQEWRERRQALKEIETISQDEADRLRLSDTNPINLAKIALKLNDHTEALRQWRRAITAYPAFAKGNRDTLEVLLGLKLYDEAEAIMLEGKQREPRDQYFEEGYAQVAQERGDLNEADRRWAIVRKEFPGWWSGFVYGAVCLRRMGRLGEAEALIESTVRTFPNSPHAWLEWIRCAEARSDWTAVMQRAEQLHETLHHSAGDVYAALALEKLGRLDEAMARLEEARYRWPLVIEIAVAQARIPFNRGDKEESARRWARAKQRFPLAPMGYQGEMQVLRDLGHFTKAEAVALEAIDRFPADPWPAIEYAGLAELQQNWDEAAERWAIVRRNWPQRDEGYTRGAAALAHLGKEGEAAALRAEAAQRRGTP